MKSDNKQEGRESEGWRKKREMASEVFNVKLKESIRHQSAAEQLNHGRNE